jgi:hypothetical protein
MIWELWKTMCFGGLHLVREAMDNVFVDDSIGVAKKVRV